MAFISFAKANESNISEASLSVQAPLPEVTKPNTDNIHHVIEEQLRAFRERDAENAFSFASENLKGKYRNSKHFMKTVRFSYKPLYEHLSYAFLDQNIVNGDIIQKVEMIDRKGMPILVLYKLKKMDDQWLIDGYTVLNNDAQPS